MEDHWHGPEDPANQEPESTRKKRRGTDFLSQYLLRRREHQGEHIEEDDEESEEKPKKKFRNFFKGLFKGMVETPEFTTGEQPKRFKLENLFMGSPEQSQTEQVADGSSEAVQETAAEASEGIQADYPEANQTLAEQPTRLEEPAFHVDRESRSEPMPPAPDEQPSFEQQHETPPVTEQTTSIDRTVFERQQTQPTEKEVVIERGPGIALPVVLVGAEYSARKKADKKLEKRVNEKIMTTNKEVDRRAVLQQELETLTRQNQEQLEALKRDRGIATPNTEKHPRSERVEQTVAHSERLKPEQQPEKRAEVKQAPQIIPEKDETYKIMEQVAEAAEHDIPVERVFERSHEVKDDQTVPVGAASIGAIMANQVAKRRISGQSTASQHPEDTSGLPVLSDHAQTLMYRQAMKNGFWAAIIIIILGTIAYLLK